MKDQKDGVVRAAGILLMVDRPNPEFLLMKHPQRWDLPKGHCELGESFREAALRETEEETGIAVSCIDLDPNFLFELRYPVTYKKTGDKIYLKTVQYFLGRIQAKPKLVLTEHESAQWFPWEPPHRIQTETIDPLLAAVDRFLKSKHQ